MQRYASSSSFLANDLKGIVGNENVSSAAAVREQHGHDESYYPYARLSKEYFLFD